MNHSPEEIFDKLIKNRITREEFEALLAGLDDAEATEQYEIYLQQKFEEEIEKHQKEHKPSRKIPVIKSSRSRKTSAKGNKNFYSMAAAIIFFVGAVFAILFFITQYKLGGSSTVLAVSEPATITKSTPNGRMFRMNLDDGSFVQLNAASSLTYPNHFVSGTREVSMSGEAYFNIVRDTDRPFKIHTHNIDIEVLGTSFSVQAFPNEEDLSVTVESGTVRVLVNNKVQEAVVLEKGQRLVVIPGENLTEIMDVNPELEMSWRSGVLRFDGTPMKKVARMLERWYGVNVVLEDAEKLEGLTLSGIHKNENLKSVVQAITFATGTNYDIKDNSLIIKN